MHIHPRAFRHFDMIRRCGSIREAARRLHVSSSALNRQLLQLEDELGSPLFERLPGGLRLTPVGEIFSRHVLTVLQDAKRMDGELDALRGLRRGSIDVVCVESLTMDFLPGLLERMIERYPGIRLSVRVAGSAAAAQAVANADADVAIGFVLNRSEALRQIVSGRFALGAVVPPKHPLAKFRQVSFADCARHPLILAGPELSIHWEMRSLLAAHKRSRTVVLETGSLELMKNLALRGTGVAFVNRFGVERELARGELRHIPLKPGILFNLGVYVRADRALPPAIDAFTRLVAEEIREREAAES